MVGKRLAAFLLAAVLAASLAPGVAFASSAEGGLSAAQSLSGKTFSVQGKSAKNAAAHAAYAKKMRALKEQGMFVGSYKYKDITGDGVDELVLAWWPSVYTYQAGKLKSCYSAAIGSTSIRFFAGKKVFVAEQPDHLGSFGYTYFKWNGKKFVKVATMYTPSSWNTSGGTSNYWVKGKGKVSKAVASKYVKRITGGKHATLPSYDTF